MAMHPRPPLPSMYYHPGPPMSGPPMGGSPMLGPPMAGPMVMRPPARPGPGPAPWLLSECWVEADKCFTAACQLDGLCQAIPPAHRAHLIATAEEVRATCNQLRTLTETSNVHFQRVKLIVNDLNLVLPSIKKTITDITGFYENRSLSRDMRWRTMYHTMTQEAANIPLPQRFILYNTFIDGLLQLLTRDNHFHDNHFQAHRDHIMNLRGQQQLGASVDIVPAPPPGLLRLGDAPQEVIRKTRWAEKLFSRPLSSRTNLNTKNSEVHGILAPAGHSRTIPQNSKVFFERPFDNNTVLVSVYEDKTRHACFIQVTSRQTGGIFYTELGVYEIGIKREHSSILEIRRWSRSQNKAVLWAVLSFITWEELVLFYCAMLSLKITSELTAANPKEFLLDGEKRLFQAKIIDNRCAHSLIVYKDKYTKGWRLHAAIWDGSLRQAPVWTAFITELSRAPRFLRKKSPHRVWLYDLELYVFSDDYCQDSQCQKDGAFELQFDSENGASHFIKLFDPPSTEPSETTASIADSDEHSADDDDHVHGQVSTRSAATSTSTSNVTSAATSEDGESSVGPYSDDEDDDDVQAVIRSETPSVAHESDSQDDAYSEVHSAAHTADNDEARSEDAYRDDRRGYRDGDVESNDGHGCSGRDDHDRDQKHRYHGQHEHHEQQEHHQYQEDRHYDADDEPHPAPQYHSNDHPGELSVEEIHEDELSIEEMSDDGNDSDRSSLGGLSDGATLKIERRESLLEAPEEISRLEAPAELSRLPAPKEPARITDGRPPKPTVEDCSEDDE